ncbi:MAG: efflux transporter outer membrane subunit [Proteobacteria bacterium]|nr:efflux transporter outer membrane subunit [Pseudomonadota bacterium]
MQNNPCGNIRAGSLACIYALAASALLGACATVQPPVAAPSALSVPSTWSTMAAAVPVQPATSLAHWWQRFDNPLLTALITQALQANTSVHSAQAALAQARAQQDVQQAGLAPTVVASTSAQRNRVGRQDASNLFQAGFDASWEPDVFGGQRSTVAASRADTLAAQTSLADVQVSLAAEVAVNLITLRGLQARLAIAQSNLDTQTETLQITRWRTQAGLTSSLDLEQAVAASEQTAALLPALQTSIDQNLHALAVLTGQAPGALQASLAPAQPIPQAPADLALAFPAETLRQRADVRSAEHRVSAALARVSAADAARYPSFGLSGSLGLSALTLGTLTDGASVLKSLLASVSVPVLDGGARRAQVRVQRAVLDQAHSSYQATVLGALQEVEDALVALRGDRDRLARLQAAAEAASNAELLARQRYTSGLIDFSAVLDTQRTLLATQDGVASAEADVVSDHVRLYKALGGGWVPDTEPA